MSTLTKDNIAKTLNEQLGLSVSEAKEMVEDFFDEIRATLAEQERVQLSGWGNFDVRGKLPRPGRNPKTGENVVISARRVIKFGPSPKLRAAIEQLSMDTFS
ncbi:MAG: integration host factor subunit alpha [Pseudomonadota bacterium]